jgi:adenylate kinase family enzyme
MTQDQLYGYIEKNLPKYIYLTGKTCTGKSTFANKLVENLNYSTIELDKIVRNFVIKKFDLSDEGNAFGGIYGRRDKLDWINSFVRVVQEEITKEKANSTGIIIEGAVSNVVTIKEMFSDVGDFEFIYFHPQYLKNYIRNIKNRFSLSDKNNNAGLPTPFWNLIDPKDFEKFCIDKIITSNLEKAISEYASFSKNKSEERLKYFSDNFINIKVVNT